MKQYPAIDVRTDDADLVLAIVDDFGPSAVEERDGAVRIFFAETRDRDEAQAALASRFDVAAVRHYLGIEMAPIYCTRTASKLSRTYT